MDNVIQMLVASIFGCLLSITIGYIKKHKKAPPWPMPATLMLLIFIYGAYLGFYPKIEIYEKTNAIDSCARSSCAIQPTGTNRKN